MADQGKLDIYMDAGCAFCRWSRARIEPWDTRARLLFEDYNDPQVTATVPYSPEELDREMHVRLPDGRWAAGFQAWTEILRVLPGLAWLGWLLGKPPLRWLGPSAYRWVARHRDLLPGAPAPCNRVRCDVTITHGAGHSAPRSHP